MFHCVEWDDCWLWGYVKNVVELEQASDVLGIWEPLIKLIRKNPISLFRAWKSSPFIIPVQTWETSRYCPVSNSVLNSLRFPDYETYLFPLPFVVSSIEMCCWINHCRFRGTPLWVNSLWLMSLDVSSFSMKKTSQCTLAFHGTASAHSGGKDLALFSFPTP